jgi:formylglycine-generating enzyme required for sulfatase activity
VSGELAAVVAKMMAKDPAQRYQTPAEVAQALVPFVKAGAKGAPVEVAGKVATPKVPGTTETMLEGTATVTAVRKTAAGRTLRAPAPAAKSTLGKWGLVGAGAAAVAGVAVLLLTLVILWGAGVFRVRTADGSVLVVEVNEANADVFVDGEKVTVTWGDAGKTAEIGVKAGTRKVELKKDGFTIWGEEVEIADGKRRILTARLSRVALPPDGKGKPHPSALNLDGGVTVQFVRVPRGTFWMGWDSDKKQSKQVTILKDFELGACTVTQEQWQALMLNNPSAFSRTGICKAALGNTSDAVLKRFPVDDVSWDDVQVFLKKLNTREDGKGWLYRLPREAEWEYACRNAATTKEECSFDFYFDGGTSGLSSKQANFNHEFPAVRHWNPTPVGVYPPNKLGLYDMHGNAWQWCEDLWADTGTARVSRGGSRLGGSLHCRAASRNGVAPSARLRDLGFRLARVPSGS